MFASHYSYKTNAEGYSQLNGCSVPVLCYKMNYHVGGLQVKEMLRRILSFTIIMDFMLVKYFLLCHCIINIALQFFSSHCKKNIDLCNILKEKYYKFWLPF